MKTLEKQLPNKANFRLLCHLIALILGQNSVKILRVTKNVKAIKFKGVWLEYDKKFPETITHKIFETNSSFHVK